MDSSDMDDVQQVRLFPIRGPMFPGQREVLNIFEDWAVELLDQVEDESLPGRFGVSWRGTGYGSIVHVVEHEHFNNNEQLFHRVVVCAIRRFRILSEWTGSDGVTWAKVDYVDDVKPGSIIDVLRGGEFRSIQKSLDAVKAYFTQFFQKFERNSLWRTVASRTAPFNLTDPEKLSFWICAVLPAPPKVPIDTLKEFFMSDSTPRRLAKAFALFQESTPFRGRAANKVLPVTTSQVRALQRTAGLKPLVRYSTLQEACSKVASEALPVVLPSLRRANARVLQMVLDRANVQGLIDDEILRALCGSASVRALHLMGNKVLNEWLHVGALGSFQNLTELQLLSCFRLEDGPVRDTLTALPRLRILSIDRCRKLGCAAIRDALPAFSELRHLSVGGTLVKRESLDLMCSTLPSLRELDVSSLYEFSDATAAALLTADLHPGLTMLLASSTRIGNEGAAALAAQTHLQTLNLAFNPRVTDWAFLASLSQLTDLDLSQNYTVDDDAIDLIAQALTALQFLNLAKTDVSNAGVGALRTLRELRVLNLGRTAVGDGLRPALACMPLLQGLLLPYSQVTDALAHSVAELPSLTVLKLTGCVSFGTRGLEIISEAPLPCANLVSLDVGSQEVTNDCVRYVRELRALESLQLWETSVNTPAAQAISRDTGLVIDDRMSCTAGTWIFLSAERMEM